MKQQGVLLLLYMGFCKVPWQFAGTIYDLWFMIFRWHIIQNAIIWSALQQFVGDFGQIALDSL